MPTLPLYTPGESPDASHRVAAPGGYEFWRFEGVGASGDVRFVATLGVGHRAHPEYLRRYARYRRRPTRHPPPLPAEYPCVHFAAYANGAPLGQFTEHLAADQFSASPQQLAVTIGANAAAREPDGTTSLRLRGVASGSSTRGRAGQTLSAQLTFRPAAPHAARELELLPRSPDGDLHRWAVAGGPCEVSGFVSASGGDDGNGRGVRDVDVSGRGFHDHAYGTGPLGLGMRHWMRGTLLLRDRALAFHLFEPAARGSPPHVRAVAVDAAGVRDLPARINGPLAFDVRSGAAAYPRELRIDVPGGAPLVLQKPRVLASDATHTRLIYTSAGGGFDGEVFCEAAATPKTAWPPAGRVDLREAEQPLARAGEEVAAD